MSNENEQRIDRFLDCMKGYVVRKDRGALADLRRGFSAATENRTWPYLASWCDLTNQRERAIWRTIAAGFAVLKGSNPRAGNMGATLRRIAVEGRQNTSDALKSFDGRFRRLLVCRTAEEVCERMPGVLRVAEQKGISVDFKSLFWDLICWQSDKRDVRVEWASAYWGAGGKKGGDKS